MNKPWRDDHHSSDTPTVNIVVPCAVDRISAKDGVYLDILHVKAFRGKGFMPHVNSLGYMANGKVHEAYADAVAEGSRIQDEYVKKIMFMS